MRMTWPSPSPPTADTMYVQFCRCTEFCGWFSMFYYAKFEVFTAVTLKHRVFWDVTSCSLVEV
jgi:hypothetical protein